MTSRVIPPGATLGVLGSGQLGRMFAIAARRLGYRVHVFSPDRNTPTGAVADLEFSGEYSDFDLLSEFARGIDVCTFEFENVPSAVSGCIEKYAPVRPSAAVLNVSQHRLREKSELRKAGLPVPDFHAIRSLADLQVAVTELGFPCVLKTAMSGYDGKGQVVLRSNDDCPKAWASLATSEAILEEFVDFDCEVSVIGARNTHGEAVFYGPFRNMHENHILDVTVSPAGLSAAAESRALEVSRTVFDALDVTGVLCVEMFVTRRGDVLINELAPRPHNSGHLTIDANVSCQFEQQVRAICGLPLGGSRQHGPAAMANLLGDLWEPDIPNWLALMSDARVKLHLYGKELPKPGRKMGHITALGNSTAEAEAIVRKARQSLRSREI